MDHIYKEHTVRNTTSLNGEWQFCTDPENVGLVDKWYGAFPADSRFLNVPGCWNLQALDLFGYKGVAWYQKNFAAEDGILKIEFGAVSGEAQVYLDGVYLGQHYGGWTAFSFTKAVTRGSHRLTVRVDATQNQADTIPMKRVDWYNYGGIARSVEISQFRHAYIDSHRISYRLNDTLTEAALSVNLAVKNCGDTVPVEIRIEEEIIFSGVLPVRQGVVQIDAITLSDIKLWDVGQGNLYTVHILLPEDDIIEKIGFREIKAENRKIYLNRKEIFFKGVNRHEEHADWGFSVPANISRRDLEIIKNLGCNFVRGSHYPQSHTWIDYLDREGILFWSEIPMWGWGYNGDTLHGALMERSLHMHREMAEQYYHHPAIVVWGLHNEIRTDTQEAYNATKAFAALLRSIAPDRLITYASNKYHDDICLEFVDFISLNYYHGWYGGSLKDWKDFLENALVLAKEKGVGGKPMVMSEFGCAAISGYSNFSDDKWTMQYQCDMVRTVIEQAVKTEGFCGTLVWQFADIKSDVEINRARSFNNKGLVDEYRRPKMAYYTVKALYESIP